MKNLLLLLVFLVMATLTSFQDPEYCPMTGGTDPNALCAKPLTGCLCQGTGIVTGTSISGCGGCVFMVNGQMDCTFSPGLGYSVPITCSSTLPCASRGACGTDCPCTGAAFTPFVLAAASAPDLREQELPR